MLMSLLDARRASSASILEKPISTSRATCWDDGTSSRLNNFSREINKATDYDFYLIQIKTGWLLYSLNSRKVNLNSI